MYAEGVMHPKTSETEKTDVQLHSFNHVIVNSMVSSVTTNLYPTHPQECFCFILFKQSTIINLVTNNNIINNNVYPKHTHTLLDF